VHRLLRPSNPSPLLIDALTIISQLARVQPTGGSCNMYEPLLKSNLLPLIRQLMEQQDAGGCKKTAFELFVCLRGVESSEVS
jgi:hypothetical protein